MLLDGFGSSQADLRLDNSARAGPATPRNSSKVIPFDGDTGPILFRDDTLIVLIIAPIHAVADVEARILAGGHAGFGAATPREQELAGLLFAALNNSLQFGRVSTSQPYRIRAFLMLDHTVVLREFTQR